MERVKIVVALLLLLIVLVNHDMLLMVKAKHFNVNDFPSSFIFGASTSAYQVEGATLEDGRTPSIFDTAFHEGRMPGNGDAAADGYHKYKEDVQLMNETGLGAYRFSISWSRLIPDGRGRVNPKGLEYYNNLINELIKNGIEPHVTLLHFDLPQVLEDEYKGFLNRSIVDDFTAYADVCFREFGDRVRHWITINEANIFVIAGYDYGMSPPNRCSLPWGWFCTKGDSTTEPYLAAHHIILAHASASKLYKEKYLEKQKGMIGLSLLTYHFIPYATTLEDEAAAKRSYDFFIGWFMNPLTNGDYPEIMKKNVGKRLPVFNETESEMVKGSLDFVGVNYYTVMIAQDNSTTLLADPRDYTADVAAPWIDLEGNKPLFGVSYKVTPWGLLGVLEHFKQVYNNPSIFIYENGQLTQHNASLNDTVRVDYLQNHVGVLIDALRNGSNTKGYFVWSFVDVFELMFGDRITYGLYYVDFDDPNFARTPKLSQKWYSNFLRGENGTIKDEWNQHENISMAHTGMDLLRHTKLHNQQKYSITYIRQMGGLAQI